MAMDVTERRMAEGAVHALGLRRGGRFVSRVRGSHDIDGTGPLAFLPRARRGAPACHNGDMMRRMRDHGSVALIFLAGCASGPKPRADVERNPVQRAPAVIASSPADAARVDPSQGQLPAPSTAPSQPTESFIPSATESPPAAAPPTVASERHPTPAERRACAARGGTIQPVCMAGELECVIRYRDGGKRCSDKRDCAGECLYEGPDPAPPRATGSCQRTSDPCGCKSVIHHGHAEPALCAD